MAGMIFRGTGGNRIDAILDGERLETTHKLFLAFGSSQPHRQVVLHYSPIAYASSCLRFRRYELIVATR